MFKRFVGPSEKTAQVFTSVIGRVRAIPGPTHVEINWGQRNLGDDWFPITSIFPLKNLLLLGREVGEQLFDKQHSIYKKWTADVERELRDIAKRAREEREAREREEREEEERRRRRWEEEQREEEERRRREQENAGFNSQDQEDIAFALHPGAAFCGKYKCGHGASVKRCYRKKSLKLHPDKNRGREEWAKPRFQALNNDYSKVKEAGEEGHTC